MGSTDNENTEDLRAEIQRLKDRIEQLEQENRRLREQLEQVRQQSFRQAAPFRCPEPRKIPPDQHKRPGRKPGHPGSYRPVPPILDERIEIPLERCPRCQGPVHDCHRHVQIIEELPPIRPRVTAVITYEGQCPRCGSVRSVHPLQTSTATGCARVQLGPRALAWAAMLNKGMGLTVRTTQRILQDLFGLQISPGGICHALARIADRVQKDYAALIQQVRTSPAVHADETSWWVGGPGWWLWTFTTPQETAYVVEHQRGSAVVRSILGEAFKGMLVSDCLSSYDPIECAKHKCIAHHLRAIAEARKLPGMTEGRYLDQWTAFFHGVLILYKLRAELPPDVFVEKRQALETWCDTLLALPAGQTGDEAIRHRLLKQRPYLLGCLYNPAAEPTNNRAERSLRPAVIARKLSCGNKTERGRTTWQILASLATTAHQQGMDFAQQLIPKLALQPTTGNTYRVYPGGFSRRWTESIRSTTVSVVK